MLSYFIIFTRHGLHTTQNRIYPLPQKKRDFNFQILHGDPGPGSVTPGHVHQGKCSWEQQTKDPIEKYQTVLSVHSIIWEHIFPWLSRNNWNPIAANANSVIFLYVCISFWKECMWVEIFHCYNLAQSLLTYTPPQKKGNLRKVAFLLGKTILSILASIFLLILSDAVRSKNGSLI